MRVDLFAVSDLLLPQPHPIGQDEGRQGRARGRERGAIGDMTADVAQEQDTRIGHVLVAARILCAPLVIKFLIYCHENATPSGSQRKPKKGSSPAPVVFRILFSSYFCKNYILIERAATDPPLNAPSLSLRTPLIPSGCQINALRWQFAADSHISGNKNIEIIMTLSSPDTGLILRLRNSIELGIPNRVFPARIPWKVEEDFRFWLIFIYSVYVDSWYGKLSIDFSSKLYIQLNI